MSKNNLLQPSIVFDCFAEVNKIPRPSKKEEKMIAFLKAFGEGFGSAHKSGRNGQRVHQQTCYSGLRKQQNSDSAKPHGHGLREEQG